VRNQVELDELISLHPLLYHMAADGSWPSIARHGLLSTTALLDLFDVVDPLREAVEARRRFESVPLTHLVHGQAVVRDQKPMTDASVEAALRGTGLTPRDWYLFLNHRVFFWLTEERLLTMLTARPYRDKIHIVLLVNARGLVTDHLDEITLSPMNSGATRPFPHPRSLDTFKSLSEYPFADLRRRRSARNVIVELAVEYSVPNISDYVVEVRRMRGSQIVERLWPAPASPAEPILG
jgi:hypothetical protein